MTTILRKDARWNRIASAAAAPHRTAIAAAAALAFLAAGCGGASGTSDVAHLGSTSTTSDKSAIRDPMASAIKYARCMRKHGVTDFPDPQTRGNGNIMLSVPDSPAAKAAEKSCRRLLPGGGAPPANEQAQRLASLLKYARCMRKHGVPDFPDPDNQGEFPSSSGFNRGSPIFQAAQKTCQPFAGGFVKHRG